MPPPPFDLVRYLDRIGLATPPRPDLDGLAAVQAAQLRAVPFENIDVLLRGGIDVEPAAVFAKLVTERRGGYCFECNGLLCAALRAIGFEARPLLARVVIDRGEAPVPARTHAIVQVRLDGALQGVDCGFGAQTPRAPFAIDDGATCGDDTAAGGWLLQTDGEFGWRLSRTSPGEPPRDLYVFDQVPVYPADVALGNYWTSTHPSSHFTMRPIAVRHTDRGRIVLSGRRLIEQVGAERVEHVIESPQDLLYAIRERAGIALAVDDEMLARLWEASAEVGG